MIVLSNRSNRKLEFALTHAEFCRDGDCSCVSSTLVVYATTKAGMPGVGQKRVRQPAVLTVLAGERVEVREAVLRVTEVATAIARGLMTVERLADPPAPTAPAAPLDAPPVDTAHVRARTRRGREV